MSLTANWSYTNIATVRPFVSVDLMSGQTIYGPEFDIACTWTAESKQARDSNGAEFVTRNVIYTEDPRPKYLDLIKLSPYQGETLLIDFEGEVYAVYEQDTEWQEIRDVTNWDMSFFGEKPDYKLVT